jgi:hypothetical protein
LRNTDLEVHHTTHGTPTRKKENTNSRGKRKNVKRRKREKTATTTYIRSTHAEKWTTSKDGTRLNKNKSFKNEKF